MLIGNKLIRKSIGSYAVINVIQQTIAIASSYTTDSIVLGQSEHGFLWKAVFMTENSNYLDALQIRINGAGVFTQNDHVMTFPKWPGAQQGITFPFENMYFPPNSTIDLVIYNNSATNACIIWGHFIVYKFYDRDLEVDFGSPECPLWLKEPPSWLVQAIENIKSG